MSCYSIRQEQGEFTTASMSDSDFPNNDEGVITVDIDAFQNM